MKFLENRMFLKKPWELHADNWDGRNIGKVWAKVSKEVKWSYLTIPHFISYRGTVVSFGNLVHNFLISKSKISTTFTTITTVLIISSHLLNTVFIHSKESNCISEFGVARQNWCILSIHDKIEKFSIFSEVYENKILGTLEPELEPPKFTISCGRALKSKNPCFSSL